jgi:hypothetical protein
MEQAVVLRRVFSALQELMALNLLRPPLPGAKPAWRGSTSLPLALRSVCCVQQGLSAHRWQRLIPVFACSARKECIHSQLALPLANFVIQERTAQVWEPLVPRRARHAQLATIQKRLEQLLARLVFLVPRALIPERQEPHSYRNALFVEQDFTPGQQPPQAMRHARLALSVISRLLWVPPLSQHVSCAAKDISPPLRAPAPALLALLAQSAQQRGRHPAQLAWQESTIQTLPPALVSHARPGRFSRQLALLPSTRAKSVPVDIIPLQLA